MNDFDYNDLTRSIWQTLSNRLQQEIIKDEEEDENNTRYTTKTSNSSMKGINIELKEDSKFDGIINYLKNQTNDNILETILNVTTSTLYSQSYPATYLLDDDPRHYFGTQNKENSWICFEFKNHQVKLTHYKIKTNNGGCNIRNWKLEGSNDKESWELLDEQMNCEYTHGDNKVHSFQINKQQNQKFKYIRLLSTGQNWGNDHYFVIGAIDFYGTLL